MSDDPEQIRLDALTAKHLRKQLNLYEVMLIKEDYPRPEDVAVYGVLKQIQEDAYREFES